METRLMAEKRELIDSLNVDLRKEHAAIVQYLLHAWQMGERTLASEVEEISREEMWHMEWLAEAITGRGGTPDVTREQVFTHGSMLRSLQADIDAEEGAIEHYASTRELARDDEGLARLIDRIVDDERHHKTGFGKIMAEVREAGEDSFRAEAEVGAQDAGAVVEDIELEYEGLLQYLFNKYGCGDCERGETYFELAVNEMRHLDWLAEATAGDRAPSLPEGVTERVTNVHSVPGAQHRAHQYEGAAIEAYRGAANRLGDPGFEDTVKRILGQHDYHVFQLERIDESQET